MAERSKKRFSIWRVLIIGLAAILVLFGAALAIVPHFIPWDKIKKQSEEKISAQLNHQVKMESIKFGLIKGIELTGLEIANGVGFSKEPLLRDEAAIVKYRLLPLVLGRVVVKAIEFKNPQLLIEKNSAGVFNFSDMISKKAAKPEPVEKAEKKEATKVKALPFDILVSQVSISGASLAYRDSAKKQEYKLDNLNLTISNLTLAGLTPIRVLLETDVHALGQSFPFVFKSAIRFNYAQQSVLLDSAGITLPGLLVEAQGKIEKALADPTAAITGKTILDVKKILKEVVPTSATKSLPKDFSVDGPVMIGFDVNGPVKILDKLVAKIDNTMALKIQNMGMTIPLDLKGSVLFENNNVTLKQNVSTTGLKTVLSATIKDVLSKGLLFSDLDAKVDLKKMMDAFVPPTMQKKLKAISVDGNIHLKTSIHGPATAPKQLALKGSIKAKDIGATFNQKTALANLNATILFNEKSFEVKSLKALLPEELLEFTMSASGFDLRDPATLKPKTMKTTVQWNLESKMLNLDALMALMPQKEKTAGDKTSEKEVKKAAKTDVAKKVLPEPDARRMMPSGLKVRGAAKLGGVQFGKVKLGQIHYDMNLSTRLINNKVKLQGYKGSINNTTTLNFTKKLLSYSVDAAISGVDLEPLLNDVLDTFVAAKLKKPEIIKELKDKLTGRMSGKLFIKGKGMRVATVKQKMTGNGDFRLDGSRIRKFAFQQNLAQWFGNNKFNQDMPFDRVLVVFNMANQLVKVTTFKAESGPKGLGGDIRLTAKGGIRFDASFKDFRMKPRVSKRAASNMSPEFSKYTEILKDENGWIALPIIMNGPMKKPQVLPDWDWIKKQFGNYAKRKAQKAAKTAEKKLKKIIEKQKGKSAEEIKKDVGKELEKLKDFNLNNLFK